MTYAWNVRGRVLLIVDSSSSLPSLSLLWALFGFFRFLHPNATHWAPPRFRFLELAAKSTEISVSAIIDQDSHFLALLCNHTSLQVFGTIRVIFNFGCVHKQSKQLLRLNSYTLYTFSHSRITKWILVVLLLRLSPPINQPHFCHL